MSGDRFVLGPLRRRADSRQVCDERMAAIAPRGCLVIQSGISPPSVTESAAMSKRTAREEIQWRQLRRQLAARIIRRLFGIC